MNSKRVPQNKDELKLSNFELLIYPFSEKKVATTLVLSSTKDPLFSFKLKDCELTGYTYVQDIDDTVLYSEAKYFSTYKRFHKKLCGDFITHVDGDPVFSTAQAADILKTLYEQLIKAKDQVVADNFVITFNYKDK